MPESSQISTVLSTAFPRLRLVEVRLEDAGALYRLIVANRAHLTQHGDWTDLAASTLESVTLDLRDSQIPPTRFGIWLEETLIGRADLNPRGEDNFVLGYWLGGDFTGQGYATAACAALIAYGKANLAARRVYAGVTMGNRKSEAVLARLGFEFAEDRGAYTLFLRTLS